MKRVITNWLSMLCSESTPRDFLQLMDSYGKHRSEMSKSNNVTGNEVEGLYAIKLNWYFCIITVELLSRPCCHTSKTPRLSLDNSLFVYLFTFLAVDGHSKSSRSLMQAAYSPAGKQLPSQTTWVKAASQ